MISFLCGVVKRSFLFQFFFIFAYLKYSDMGKSSYEFKDKVYEASAIANLKHPMIDRAFANPMMAFQVFLGVQVFSAGMAVLGSRFFSFLSGLLLLAGNVVYNNPLRVTGKPNQPISIEKLTLTSIPIEFILLCCLSLGILTQAFTRGCCRRDTVIEEAGHREETPDARRTPTVSSGKKKRVH